MKEFIQELIEKKKNRYIEDYSEMIGDYNRELETIKGYNGRQLLELLQNCDDEGATQVLIKLDPDDKTITISNNGTTSFSKKGYRSLFIANLSSKTSKRKYIGNKGLGFRSIINWSNSIEIQSNDLSLFYSEKNTKNSYNQLFSDTERNKIALEEGFDENSVPMPFLSMPLLKEIKQESYRTSIIIQFKEKAYKDIFKQVKNITPETLLFLKHIEEINFSGFEEIENIKCTRNFNSVSNTEFCPKEMILFSDNSWSIFEEENELPLEFQTSNKDEKEFYQIKIAVEDNFQKTSPYLYSFFPTNIKLNQPYVLHATFDLDATRNQLNDSEKNRFILKQIVAFTIKVSKFYTKEKVSYQPLAILNHSHKADTLENLGYYDLIEKAIHNESVFPCIDNEYRLLKDVIYINDEFAEFLLNVNATDVINIHILPLKNHTLKEFNIDDEIDQSLEVLSDYMGVINEISHKDLTIGERARFIRIITEVADFLKPTDKIDFLINKDLKIIKGQEYIYTPITQNQELKTPNFTKIQFVNENLFNALLIEFKFYGSDKSNKSRFIYDQLKEFCNIHSYEPATLAQKIIRETNNAIEKDSENGILCIKEMNKCLFHNFKLMSDRTKIPDDAIKIPSITKSNNIEYTEDLMLSEFYPTGKKTVQIFSEVYTNDDFVANPEDLGLDKTEDEYELENYLKWIKVNSFARYKNNSVKNHGLEDYVKYVQNHKGFGRITGYEVKYKEIYRFKSILKRISLEKFILWIYYDSILKEQLDNQNNKDTLYFFYRTNYPIYNQPSLIRYEVKKYFPYNFSELLIDEKYSWVNDLKINYKEIIDFDNSISKTVINGVLISLGAKDDFKNLPIDRVAQIINKLPENYPTGAKSQLFYKKALAHYSENNIEIKEPLKLFANNGKELKLYDHDEIYFSEKIKLPNRLKQDFPIFNFPARAGGSDAIKFFGINDLKSITIEILDKQVSSTITEKFKQLLDDLKPFLLSYRLNVIEDIDVRKIQASICKKIEIILCDKISYKVKDHYYDVADYEFLHYKEQTYFIKINEFDSISSLRKNVDFTNSFSDIISLAFDVTSDKNEYKYILRSDYEDVKNSIKNDLGEDTLNESREYLGLADYKQAFWQAIFITKDVTYNDYLDDLALEEKIKNELLIEFDTNSLDYEKINSENELSKIEHLLSLLKIELVGFAKNYAYNISIAPYHLSKIKDAILSKKNIIKSSIWQSLLDEPIEKKEMFLQIINKFENFGDYAQLKAGELKHYFKINKDQIFKDFKNHVYGDLVIQSDLNLEKIKRENKDFFSEDELYEISQSERLKSLLYFKDTLNIIKEELQVEEDEQSFGENVLTVNSALNNTGSLLVSPRILNSDSLVPKRNINGHREKGVYTPKEKSTKTLKEKGNKSEDIVYDYLINNGFKNVDRVSEDNEGLQCDIRYTNDLGEVKYVEVKTFDHGNFHLSKPEYDFGKVNQKDYEIWLVKNKQDIIPIFDFFENPKYKTTVNEYLIHLEIV